MSKDLFCNRALFLAKFFVWSIIEFQYFVQRAYIGVKPRTFRPRLCHDRKYKEKQRKGE
jgi:hypothetical protein